MDEKFYQSIISGIQEMEALKVDYENETGIWCSFGSM